MYTIAVSLIMTRLDFCKCNSMLWGLSLSATQLNRLQRIQRSVTGTRPIENITPVLKSSLWLPISRHNKILPLIDTGFPQTFCDKIPGLFKDFSRIKICFFKDLDVL